MSTQHAAERAPALEPDPDGGGTPVLQVDGLDVAYGDASMVLRGVSLIVPEGGSVAILGANGAGKTTLIRAISGLLGVHRGRVRAGRILFEGESIRDSRADEIVARGIAQVPEGRMLFGNLTVEENLRVGASSGRERDVGAAMNRVMELFPVLRERRRQQAGWMSGGEQQMIAIGRALMAAPRLLLIDELSLGLAPIITEKIVEQLREARRTLGTATVLVEQNAMLALEFSDYAYILENGKIALEGSSQELMDDPQVREAYLGVGQRDDEPLTYEPVRRNWWL